MERNERFSYRAMQMHGDMRMMVCYQIWWVCVRLQCVVYNRNHQWASKRLCSHHYYLYTVQWGLRWRQRCVLAGVCLRLDDVTVLAHIYSHHKSLLMNTSHGAYYTTMTLISMGRELSHNTQTDMLARAAHTIFNHSFNATLKRIDVLLVRACTHVPSATTDETCFSACLHVNEFLRHKQLKIWFAISLLRVSNLYGWQSITRPNCV